MKFSSKSECRTYVRQRLSTSITDKTLLHNQQKKILENLEAFLKDKKGYWGAYSALNEEINIDLIIRKMSNIKWLFPVVKDKHFLEFWEASAGFQKGYAGILEPIPVEAELKGNSSEREPSRRQQISIDLIQGFLVPGLCFDRRGNRMGKGKGFYDRALEHCGAEKVGVCFSELVFDEIPSEDHDQKMDWIVTEEGILDLRCCPSS